MLLGRILIAPDVPVVRALVNRLNTPLQQADLLKDSLLDLATLAGPLQQAIFHSDVQAMLQNVVKLVPELGKKDVNGSMSWLLHLFNSSSDPQSLMAIIKQGTSYVDAAFKVDLRIYIIPVLV
uniref:Uncharacterized protein n=1 Tax=Ditylenchus dipsaci TaxID=166011 RepID=A0A915CQJ4_9BILA